MRRWPRRRRRREPGQVDVQTGNFSLYPRYTQQGRRSPAGRARAELIVEGRDMAAIAPAQPAASRRMTIARVGYRLSREAREKVEADVAAAGDRRATAPRPPSYAQAVRLRRLRDPRGQRHDQRAAAGPMPMMRAQATATSAHGDALPVEPGKAQRHRDRQRHGADEMTNAMNASNRAAARHVQCLDARGLHRMAYWEWGDPAQRRVLVCVHGLSRQGRDFDALARAMRGELPRRLPRRGRPRRVRPARRPDGLRAAELRRRHGDAARAPRRRTASHWVGTSMGGLIGMGLAALPGSPIAPAGAQRRRPGDRRGRRWRASAATSASRSPGRARTRRPTTC